MRITVLGGSLMLVATLGLMTGCSDHSSTASAARTPAAPMAGAGSADRVGAPVDQSRLVREVRHELAMLPYYNVFDNLEFRVDGSTVTLMGQVLPTPDLKRDAEDAVKHIEGVTRVINDIKVLPLSSMDDQIRREEFRAIYSFPSFTKYAIQAIPPIHIIVDTGHVTLVGVVDSQADKDAAGLRANTVPNVFSVTNNLRVERS